jgi:hypothetical protein
VRDLNALCEKSPEMFSRLIMHTLRDSSAAGSDSFSEQRHLIPGLQFLLGAGTKNNVSADNLCLLLQEHTDLSQAAVDLMCQCYGAQESGAANSDAAKVLGLGKFVGMDWKVGVGIQSSNCDNLCAPYVSLVVRMSKSGIVEAHSMELSMKEFGEFATSVREMSQAMDNL